MNSLRINSVNNNMVFEGIKRPVKTITSFAKYNPIVPVTMFGGIISTGILYKSKNDKIKEREQALRYNEKESSDLKEDMINRIMNLKKKLEAGEDIAHEGTVKHLVPKEIEERRLPDFSEANLDNNFYDDFGDDFNNMNHTQIKLKDFKKEAAIIKNKQLKKIAETICKKEELDHALLNYIRDIDAGLSNITDKKILKHLNAELKRLSGIDYDTNDYCKPEIGQGDYFFSLSRIAEIVDVYNTMTEKYSRYKSAELMGEDLYMEKNRSASYIKNFREYDPRNFENFMKALAAENGEKHYLVKDFENSQKTEALELLSNKKEMLDYMYEKYYVRKLNNQSAKKLCREINRSYGVKILLSDKTYDIQRALRVIEEELENWTKISDGKVKLPNIIDLNICDSSYLSSSAYTDIRGNIHHNGAKIYSPRIIRHEIMHINEPSIFRRFTSDPKLAKLIRSIIVSKNTIVNGRSKEVLDWDNCKYREEFLKAGINPNHVEYAYTNRNEFLSVAAEGDFNEYSSEFRKILIKIGMPEYVLNLPINDINVKVNVNRVKKILKKHPNAKYDKLVELIEKAKAREVSPQEKLLNAIFGKTYK